MSPLAIFLRDKIQKTGPIPVDEWMAICLGDSDHGYYTAGHPFGADGDFTTAPEISQIYGELLGLWTAVVWQQMGSATPFQLVELGPGRGTLMSDALRATRGVPGFLDAVSIHMIETSPVLTQTQKQALSSVSPAVTWHSGIDDVPSGPAIVIGNEFLDALPIRQFVYDGENWRERCVDVQQDTFVFVSGEIIDAELIPNCPGAVPEGSVFETSPVSHDVITLICKRLCASGGCAVFIDYGHVKSGPGETLQAVRGHKYANPLSQPGKQDLTAHVDFGAIIRTAENAGARVWGPVGQGELLERLGISARAAALLASATKEQAIVLASARQRLTSPDQMGQLFKAVALTHLDAPAPPGFEEVSWV